MDACRELQQQVFVVQVTASGALRDGAVIGDGKCNSCLGFLRQANVGSRCRCRLWTNLMQQHRQVQPVAVAQRPPRALREWIATLAPLVETAQREKAVAVEREIAGARATRAAPDAFQLRQITHQQASDVEKVPGAPVCRAKHQPELLERRRIPADRRTGHARPGHEVR